MTLELGKGYSSRNLWVMLNFYVLIEKVQTVSAQLTWSHYIELLKLKDINEINYYICVSENDNLSVRELRNIIKNNKNKILSEKLLQKIILEDISSFLKELGNGFTFIDNEYKIKMGDRYNYIDLLLFNIEFNCYVVVELKITELKKEHIGQIEIYMNYIDNNIKKIYHDKTIGIIICKKDNKFILEYCSDKRILSREFILV